MAEQIKKARKAGLGESHYRSEGKTEAEARNIVEQNAWEDFIADSLETMFTQGDPAKAIADLKSENRGLFDEIKKFVDKWVSKLKAYYKGKTISEEGAAVAELQNFEKIQKLFMEAMEDAGENFAAADVVEAADPAEVEMTNEVEQKFGELTAENDSIGTMYSTRDVLSWDIDWDPDNESSLKTQMTKKADVVNQMEPVTTVDFSKVSGNTYANILDDILKNKFGYKISRQDGAQFLFDAEAIATLRRYVHSDEEAAAVISAPYVLKRGKAISGHKNHKNLGHPSITYAAPVLINDERVNVAVCVLFGSKDRPHSLRVLMPSGKEYVMQKKKTDPKRTGASKKNDVRPSTGPVSDTKVTQPTPGVKNEKNSLRNEEVDTSPRGILMRMDVKSRKLDAEKYHLGRYQERVTLLGESEQRLAEVKAEIERLSADEKGNRKELIALRSEQRNLNTTIKGLKRDIKFTEQTDMFRKMVADGRLAEYRAEQREAEKARILEYRAMRNEITGMNDVMSVMEDEFVRLARD